VLLDGGFGTELFQRGFPRGACPETWNVDRPEVVKEIHRSYFEAGSDAVMANSFGGSAIKLASHGQDKRCYELNRAAARIANEVKPRGRFVGGDIGPTGKFLKPQGEFTEAEFEEAFAEQAKGLCDGKVDFLLIETQYDLREALCALRATRKAAAVPVFVSMTYNRVPRGFFTLMGNSVLQCLRSWKRKECPRWAPTAPGQLGYGGPDQGHARNNRSSSDRPGQCREAFAFGRRPGLIFARDGGLSPAHSQDHRERSQHYRRVLRDES